MLGHISTPEGKKVLKLWSCSSAPQTLSHVTWQPEAKLPASTTHQLRRPLRQESGYQ